MKSMADAINGSKKLLEVEVFNDGLSEGEVLNFGCGADFVKVQQKCPRNLEDSKPLERCVAVGKLMQAFLGGIFLITNHGQSNNVSLFRVEI